MVYAQSGCSGGNASTTVTVAGGNGSLWTNSGHFLNVNNGFNSPNAVAVGGKNGTLSWGGGGGGGASLFGVPAAPVSGLAVAGTSATQGFGAGGTGGNGNGAGGNGSPGYAKITYWSAD